MAAGSIAIMLGLLSRIQIRRIRGGRQRKWVESKMKRMMGIRMEKCLNHRSRDWRTEFYTSTGPVVLEVYALLSSQEKQLFNSHWSVGYLTPFLIISSYILGEL